MECVFFSNRLTIHEVIIKARHSFVIENWYKRLKLTAVHRGY